MAGTLSPSPRSATPFEATVWLPVSGLQVELAHPTGTEDLLLVEERGSTLEVALQFLRRLVRCRDDGIPDLTTLSLYDFDTMLMRCRQRLLGDRVESVASCQSASCGARLDISFGIDHYLASHRPRQAPWRARLYDVAPADSGWLKLRQRIDNLVVCKFRLPTVADLLELQSKPDAAPELAARCIEPVRLRARERLWVEKAMEMAGPSLSSDLASQCPECAAIMRVSYDPRHYCLSELRARARFIIEDVDLLAARYHWDERDILAMPNQRREAYVELARQARGVA